MIININKRIIVKTQLQINKKVKNILISVSKNTFNIYDINKYTFALFVLLFSYNVSDIKQFLNLFHNYNLLFGKI